MEFENRLVIDVIMMSMTRRLFSFRSKALSLGLVSRPPSESSAVMKPSLKWKRMAKELERNPGISKKIEEEAGVEGLSEFFRMAASYERRHHHE